MRRDDSMCADRRNGDWSPREEITMLVQWREESNAKSAIGHGVQKSVGCGDQEKPQRHHRLLAALSGRRNSHELSCCQAYGCGEEQRVRHTAMSPEIAVMYAEGKANHVDIGNHGAKGSDGAPARELLMRPLQVCESSADESMGEKGCHVNRIRAAQNTCVRAAVPTALTQLSHNQPASHVRKLNMQWNDQPRDMTRTIAYSFLVKQ